MRFEEGRLTIEGSDMDFSTSSSEHLPAQLGGMDRFVVAVNASKLLDVLSHLSTEEVLIEGSEPSRALLFTGVNDERMLLMLLMPMMLNEV